MKSFARTGSVALIILLACALAAHPRAGKKTKARPAAVPVRLELPAVSPFQTENGIQVFHIRDELPQFTIVASVGFGKLYEGRSNAGLAELLARSLTLAGSRKHPGGSLHAAVEDAGGMLSIEASWEEVEITIRVLERHSQLALDVMAGLLSEPNFNEGFLNEAKALMGEAIRRRKDNPEQLAFETAREVIFGGEGYGATARLETVNLLTLSDVNSAFRRYFCARNITLGITTSMDPGPLQDRVGGAFSPLEAGQRRHYSVDMPRIADAVRRSEKKIYFIERPIPQATIVVGTVAPSIRDPRVYSLTMMNYILGEGSFNSRLMQQIRVKRGLSYAVQSVARFRRDTGVFMAFAQTKNEQAGLTLSLLLDNIAAMGKSPVTADELEWAGSSIANSYIFDFDTSLKIMAQYIGVHYNDLPPSFITDFPGRIMAVSREAIQKDASDLFKAGLVKVVVGGDQARRDVSRFGEVVVLQP